jgi:hypothetical protein
MQSSLILGDFFQEIFLSEVGGVGAGEDVLEDAAEDGPERLKVT